MALSLKSAPEDQSLRASQLLFLSVSSFAVVSACVKSLSHIHFSEVVFFRALITLSLCIWGIRRQNLSFWGNHKGYLIGRGLAGTVALSLFFFVLQRLPLATAVTLQYLSPIFTVFWAQLLFKERASLIQWLFFMGGFVGVWMIQGFDARVEPWLAVVGVISALASGLAYTFVRRLRTTDHELVIIFYFPLVTIPAMLPMVVQNWVTPNLLDIGLLLLVGIFTQLGQIYLTRGYSLQKAANIGLVNYAGVVYAVVIGFFVFGETIPWMAALGMALIVLCILAGRIWGQSSIR